MADSWTSALLGKDVYEAGTLRSPRVKGLNFVGAAVVVDTVNGWATVTVGAGTDGTAIHDNVAGEIAAVAVKVTPVSSDLILIEDSADSNNKKRITIGSLPAGGSDNAAIHDNVAGEIALITLKATPVSGDLLIIEDSADSNNKKRVTVGSLPGGSGTDANAIHDNVAAEISAITGKATPTTSDFLLIEDAADADNKKRITIGDLPAAAPAAHTHTESDITDLDHTDTNAIHDNVSAEISAITAKGSPTGSDLLLIEDAAASNAKRSATITNVVGAAAPPLTRTITAGAGLTGGGDLSANRTLDVTAHADGSIVANANDIQVGVLATDAQHGDRGGGTQHAVVVAAGAAGFMSGADKTKLDAIPAGSSGQVQYHNGSGGLAAEAAFAYDAANNRLTVDIARASNKSEHFESGAGADEKLWDTTATGDVLKRRTRTDADGAGVDYEDVERQGTAVSRIRHMSQYGTAETVDSFSVEVDTADSPAASSLLRDKAGAAVALTAGFAYDFDISVQTHDASVYETGKYLVTAQRPTAGDAELVEVLSSGAATTSGLDMQFSADTVNDYITCQPTVGGKAGDRKVRWSVRVSRRPIVTVDT